jgi:hypothetical protein
MRLFEYKLTFNQKNFLFVKIPGIKYILIGTVKFLGIFFINFLINILWPHFSGLLPHIS